ncbi:MAG: aminoacyl-tRNA hydrolase [Deltaproteobacteria bacterium]|nr:aminoacyl-tRNA hydrolase [Deltaproteobacteria bacterium]
MRYRVRILKRIKGFRKEEYSLFIFGLGNPEKKYGKSLHNAGFMVLDLMAEEEGISFSRMVGNTLCASLEVEPAGKVFIGKPQTFMNLSGEAVRYFYRRHRFAADRLILLHDDMDIEPGRIKIKTGGGSGGHRGVESVIRAIGNADFTRVKVGVGRPPAGVDPTDYLLSPPLYEEEEDFYGGVAHAYDAIMMSLKKGVERAAGYYNSSIPYEKN